MNAPRLDGLRTRWMVARAAYSVARIMDELAVDCDDQQGQEGVHHDEKRELQRVKNWALKTAAQFDRLGNRLTSSGSRVDTQGTHPVA